ncbi:MAG TPA: efflux RND transporter periplasmic adaptor subunit [Steroidobacteraceae bacterium]|jgi:RND family efflux transporter MFP subunit|nr:efflux RND transporter periplasmic adaptor subunit [Steroidobacteraceae bacterium]
MSESDSTVLRRAKLLVGGIVTALLIGGAAVLVLRTLHASALETSTALHAKQYVTTITPAASGDGQPLTLPGTLLGVIESTVYARTNGYVLRWVKDIGASVKRGDLLAEISAPEIDQELSQAIATRVQAAASADLAKSTAERWKSLRAKDAVTQQDLDERASAYSQAQATLAAADANVARLRNLTGFNRVVAPFDGVVTRRNIDVGDLVNAGNGGTGQALFSVAQVDPLRLYIYVPQIYASQVKVGDEVTVTLAERAGREYRGKVARTARAIDTATRTMQVEIQIPNPDGELIVGSYVQATLPVKADEQALIVPTNVLLFRPEGTRVGLVGPSGKVRLVTVKLGTDFGDRVEILAGIHATDQVILNPADSLADGDTVTPVDQKTVAQAR